MYYMDHPTGAHEHIYATHIQPNLILYIKTLKERPTRVERKIVLIERVKEFTVNKGSVIQTEHSINSCKCWMCLPENR